MTPYALIIALLSSSAGLIYAGWRKHHPAADPAAADSAALLNGLPRDAKGRPILMKSGPMALVYDAKRDDPKTRWGACLNQVLAANGAGPNAVLHVDAIKPCRTDDGGRDCCPPSCIDEYKRLRAQGQDEQRAVDESFLKGHCVRGFATPDVLAIERENGLQHAVMEGDAAKIRAFAAEGADVNAHPGGTAHLTDAARAGRIDAVRALLAAGARLEAKDATGTTALWAAARSGKSDVVRVLVEAKADVNARASSGDSVLLAAVDSGDAATVRLLVAHGADSTGALARASTKSNPEIVAILTAAGPKLARDPQTLTLMLNAVRQGDVNALKAYLDRGADPNQVDRDARTPLHFAAMWSQLAVADLLLERGANPRAKSHWGAQPLDEAIGAFKPDIVLVRLLISKGADVIGARDSFLRACEGDRPAIVEALLAGHADPNAQAWPGYTALMRAARHGNRDIVAALLRAGARPDAVDPHDKTARDYAQENHHPEIARMLAR